MRINIESLEPYFGRQMDINGIPFTLTGYEIGDYEGDFVVWHNQAKNCLIYATPEYEGVGVSVCVVRVEDDTPKIIGSIDHEPNVTSFEEYCNVVKTLAEQILTKKQTSSKVIGIEDIKVEIDESLEATLSKLYQKYDIHTGDISPTQLIKWNRCVDEVTKLFGELIESNSDIKIRED